MGPQGTLKSKNWSAIAWCIFAVPGLLLWSCGGGTRELPPATVSLKQESVAMGGEIDLHVEQAPEGWSGQVRVNSSHDVTIDAQHHTIGVNPRNGFTSDGSNGLFVILVARNGREIPMTSNWLYLEVTTPKVAVSPNTDTVGPAGGPGTIHIQAADDYRWSAARPPDWIELTSPAEGSGSQAIDYKVSANASGRNRSAKIAIGDAVFEITQLAAPPSDSSSARLDPKPATDAAPVQSGLPMAKAGFAAMTVKSGHELELHIDRVPSDWSGEVVVNGSRRFPIESKSYRLRASLQNGFKPEGPAEIYVLLVNSEGRQIPLPNNGRFRITVTPAAVTLDREGRTVGAEETPGGFSVTASAGYKWSITNVPDWIRLDSGNAGSGSGTVSYRVLANNTNAPRSATFTIGDADYQVTQLRPTAIQIPFHETFQYSQAPTPIWLLMPKGAIAPVESPTRWTWTQSPGQDADVDIAKEAPSGGTCLLIHRPKPADPQPAATQMILPHINTQAGTPYKISALIKAQNPGSVYIEMTQNTPPFGPCGLAHTFQVTRSWAQYDVRFIVAGKDCDSGNNRLSIQVGKIPGKTWITDVNLVPSL